MAMRAGSTPRAGQLVPLLDGIQANLGRRPREASADSGYLSEANLASLEARVIKAYIATGRAKHPADVKRKIGGPLTQGMRRKLKQAGWRSRYRLRKQIVEPVFGQSKQARDFLQFLLRALEAVGADWGMFCPANNLTRPGGASGWGYSPNTPPLPGRTPSGAANTSLSTNPDRSELKSPDPNI